MERYQTRCKNKNLFHHSPFSSFNHFKSLGYLQHQHAHTLIHRQLKLQPIYQLLLFDGQIVAGSVRCRLGMELQLRLGKDVALFNFVSTWTKCSLLYCLSSDLLNILFVKFFFFACQGLVDLPRPCQVQNSRPVW